MKRTTIFIPEGLERDLTLYAERSGKAMASIVREALTAYLVDAPRPRSLPSFAGAFDSGKTDTADRHDDLLFKGLTPHGSVAGSAAKRPARRPASRSRKSR